MAIKQRTFIKGGHRYHIRFVTDVERKAKEARLAVKHGYGAAVKHLNDGHWVVGTRWK